MLPRLLPVVLALVIALGSGEPVAQTEQAPTILVVDVQLVLSQSKALGSLQLQLDAERDRVLTALQAREAELRQRDAELSRARGALSEEDYNLQKNTLSQDVAQFQADFQQQRRRLDQLNSAGLAMITKQLNVLIEQVAVEHQADMVLSKPVVLLVRNELEVTQEILAKLNETLPTVDLSALEQATP